MMTRGGLTDRNWPTQVLVAGEEALEGFDALGAHPAERQRRDHDSYGADDNGRSASIPRHEDSSALASTDLTQRESEPAARSIPAARDA